MKTYYTFILITIFSLSLHAQFDLPDLPYPTDAFTEVIDQQTMEIHYGKHHQGYTNKLNKAIKKEEVNTKKTIEEILMNISSYSSNLRNNAGGYYNHGLFWNSLSPEKSEMSLELKKAIQKEFGSTKQLIEKMNQQTAAQFGSGWGWLIVTKDGKLKIVTTANQDNPLMDVVPEEDQGTPILGIDVWEHAYYLTYQNQRGKYLSNIWSIINWESVSHNYARALQD